MVPTLAVVGAIVGALLGYGLGALIRASESTGGVLALTLAIVGFIGAVILGIWDFRRRAWNKILIHADRLEISRSNAPEVYAFDDLDYIEAPSQAFLKLDEGMILGRDHTLKIKRKAGGTLVLRSGEWPVRQICNALAERAVPFLARKMIDALHAGEILQFRPANFAALRFLMIGTVCVILGAALLYTWWQTSAIERHFKPLGFSVFLLTTGVSALVMSSRARGGIVVEHGGVRRGKDQPLIPWERISGLHELPDSASLEIPGERPISLGMLVRNYESCLAILRTRLRVKL